QAHRDDCARVIAALRCDVTPLHVMVLEPFGTHRERLARLSPAHSALIPIARIHGLHTCHPRTHGFAPLLHAIVEARRRLRKAPMLTHAHPRGRSSALEFPDRISPAPTPEFARRSH